MTADRVALRRAAHQLRDSPLVFADPLALTILRPEVAARLREEVAGPERSPLARSFRAFFAVRSRFAEDALDAAMRSEAGVRQYGPEPRRQPAHRHSHGLTSIARAARRLPRSRPWSVLEDIENFVIA